MRTSKRTPQIAGEEREVKWIAGEEIGLIIHSKTQILHAKGMLWRGESSSRGGLTWKV
jgi:hypothetical protein